MVLFTILQTEIITYNNTTNLVSLAPNNKIKNYEI